MFHSLDPKYKNPYLEDPYQHPGVPSNCTCVDPLVYKIYSRDITRYYCNSCFREISIQKAIKTMPEILSAENIKKTELIGAALEGRRGPDQKLIAEVGIHWIDTLLRKNMDYGSSVFQEPVLCPGLPTTSAIDVRMSDKIARIRNLKTATAQVADESIDDTYNDLGAYCLLRKVARTKEAQDGKDTRPTQQ